jgi:hypothetical protein
MARATTTAAAAVALLLAHAAALASLQGAAAVPLRVLHAAAGTAAHADRTRGAFMAATDDAQPVAQVVKPTAATIAGVPQLSDTSSGGVNWVWFQPSINIYADDSCTGSAVYSHTFTSSCDSLDVPGLGSLSAGITCSSTSAYTVTMCADGCGGSDCTTSGAEDAGKCDTIPIIGPSGEVTCGLGALMYVVIGVIVLVVLISCCVCCCRRRRRKEGGGPQVVVLLQPGAEVDYRQLPSDNARNAWSVNH